MSLLAEVTALGERLGYEGKDLAEFVKMQIDFERDERAAAREAEKERVQAEKERVQAEKERAEAEKERLEAEIRLQTLKSGNGDTSVHTSQGQFSSWERKLIPKFNESEVSKFFIAFERVATQLAWDRDVWPIIVQSVLVGKAQIAYSALSDSDSQDYAKVKEAVLNAYELVPEAYRQKFRSWQKRPFQSYVEFAKQKEIKFDEWLHSVKVNNFEGMRELILLEDFKNNIPKEVRTHIDEFNIDKLEDAAKAADRFALSHKTNFSKKNSAAGIGGGNKSGGSDSAASVGGDNKGGGSDSSSPKKSGNRGGNIVCYGCGEKGHVKSKCSKPKKPTLLVDCRKVPSAVPAEGKVEVKKEDSVKDYFRGFISTGVVKSNSDAASGRVVTVLRDTGSCQSCILESSLPEHFVKEERDYVLLGGFPNTVSSWPLESVHLETTHFSGLCKLAVVKSFPLDGVDVLLGNDLLSGGEGTAPVQPKKVDPIEIEKVEVCCKPLIPVTRSKSGKPDDGDSLDLGTLFSSVPNSGRSHDEQVSSSKVKVQSLPAILSKLDKSSLVKCQKTDKNTGKLYEEAENLGESYDLSKPNYVLKDRILYRVSRPLNANADEDWNVREQIVVPKEFRSLIMKEAHENEWGGHFGIRKTMGKIMKNFFWPSIKSDVTKFCRTCDLCQIVGKPNMKVPKAPLYPIPSVSEPFSQVVIDIVGPLPRTRSGFEYLLTIMDRTTRFPEVIPLRSIKSPVIIKHLMDFFSRYGLPRELQSDRGTNFSSRCFQEKLRELGIKHVMSTP